jgi:methylphosphotriester-DNA--protein-cysteine methyltransferase
LNKSAIPAGALTAASAPADLAAYVPGFVHRDEDAGRRVVRVLPETRMSIQIMAGAAYWLRDAGDGASWRRLPRIALWGPRYSWCYGFAAGRIRAYAMMLSAAGFARLTNAAATRATNQVIDLASLHPHLARALDVLPDEAFDAWRERVTASLRAFFTSAGAATDPIAATLPILATAEANAVAQAAEHAGLSERQYRRVFAHYYGATPKLYQRAIRVDRMLRQLHQAPWEADAFLDTPIAYADQPHAIREFRSMTGLTPGEYVRAKRDGGATLRSAPTAEIAPPEA